MSVKENDLNPDIYVGLSFPLTIGNNGFFKQTKTLLDQASHNLRNLLLTMKGERPMEPEFGSDLYRILFEPIIEEDISDPIEESILSAVATWLPYIEITKIEVGVDEQDSNRVIINITFTVSIEPNQEGQLALVFTTAA